jgi:hypothetical protein
MRSPVRVRLAPSHHCLGACARRLGSYANCRHADLCRCSDLGVRDANLHHEGGRGLSTCRICGFQTTRRERAGVDPSNGPQMGRRARGTTLEIAGFRTRSNAPSPLFFGVLSEASLRRLVCIRRAAPAHARARRRNAWIRAVSASPRLPRMQERCRGVGVQTRKSDGVTRRRARASG